MSSEKVKVDPKEVGKETLTHAKISDSKAKIGEVGNIKNWKQLVEEAIRQSINKGRKDLVKNIVPNAKEGMDNDNPSRYLVEGTDISIISMDSNSCFSYAFKLAQELNMELSIEFSWRDKENSLHPGQKGIIEWEEN